MILFPSKASPKWPKWSSIPSWLLTEARTANGISMRPLTFGGRSCLPLFPKSWDRRAYSIRAYLKGWKSSDFAKALQTAANWQHIPSLLGEVCHLPWVKQEEANGTTVHVGIQPGTVLVTRQKTDKDWKWSKISPSRKGKGQTQGRNNWENARIILLATFIRNC